MTDSSTAPSTAPSPSRPVSFAPSPLRAQSMGMPGIASTSGSYDSNGSLCLVPAYTPSMPIITPVLPDPARDAPATQASPAQASPAQVSPAQDSPRPHIIAEIDRNKGTVTLVRPPDWTKVVPFEELKCVPLWPNTANVVNIMAYQGKGIMSMSRLGPKGAQANTLRFICKEDIFKWRHVKDCTVDVNAENQVNQWHRMLVSIFSPPKQPQPEMQPVASLKMLTVPMKQSTVPLKQMTVASRIKGSRKSITSNEAKAKEPPVPSAMPIVPKRVDPPGLAALAEVAQRMSTESSAGSSSGSESESSHVSSGSSWSPPYVDANHKHPTQSGLRLSGGTANPSPGSFAATPRPGSPSPPKMQKAQKDASLAIQLDNLTPRGQEMFRERNSWFSRRSYHKGRGRPFKDREPYTLDEIRNELLVLQPSKPTKTANGARNMATSAKRTKVDMLDDALNEWDDMRATRSKTDLSDIPLLKVGNDSAGERVERTGDHAFKKIKQN